MPGGYLRFLLPAFPLLFAAAGYLAVTCAASLPPRIGAIALVLFVAVSIGRVWPYAGEIFSVGRGDDRYRAVAEFVERALPPNSVIFAMQHSGTLRLYAGRPTIRYEWFEASEIAGRGAVVDRARLPSCTLCSRTGKNRGSGGGLPERDRSARWTSPSPANWKVRSPSGSYDPLIRREEAPRPFRIVARRGPCPAPSRRWRSVLASRE